MACEGSVIRKIYSSCSPYHGCHRSRCRWINNTNGRHFNVFPSYSTGTECRRAWRLTCLHGNTTLWIWWSNWTFWSKVDDVPFDMAFGYDITAAPFKQTVYFIDQKRFSRLFASTMYSYYWYSILDLFAHIIYCKLPLYTYFPYLFWLISNPYVFNTFLSYFTLRIRQIMDQNTLLIKLVLMQLNCLKVCQMDTLIMSFWPNFYFLIPSIYLPSYPWSSWVNQYVWASPSQADCYCLAWS